MIIIFSLEVDKSIDFQLFAVIKNDAEPSEKTHNPP